MYLPKTTSSFQENWLASTVVTSNMVTTIHIIAGFNSEYHLLLMVKGRSKIFRNNAEADMEIFDSVTGKITTSKKTEYGRRADGNIIHF